VIFGNPGPGLGHVQKSVHVRRGIKQVNVYLSIAS